MHTSGTATTEQKSSVTQRSSTLRLLAGSLVIGIVFFWLQFSTSGVCCGDFDGYYHIKWSALLWDGLRHGHFPPSFTWLPLTTLGPSRYADQHFLFHVLLIPFTWGGNLVFGAKLSAALFGTIALSSVYWLILRYRIAFSLLWLLALLGCSWLFFARLSMTKAESISLFFVVIGIVLLFEGKYLWLAPLAFIYVWTYNLFVLLGLLALIWVAVIWWSERRVEWRPLAWTILGMAAGFLIHPYFPRNIELFVEHLLAKSGQLSMPSGVGFEWYSFSSWGFVKSSPIACAAMVLGYIAFGYALARSDRRSLQRPSLFLLFSTALLLVTIRSVRFMEYWPPLALLFAAFSLQAARTDSVSELASPQPPVQAGEDDLRPRPESIGRRRTLDALPWAMLLAAFAVYNLHATQTTMQRVTPDPEHYRAGAAWIRDNVPAGALIYNVNWTDFPKLFFYDDAHSYISGLDPLYLEDVHPELAELNLRLSRRKQDDPGLAIRSLLTENGIPGPAFLFVGDTPAPPSREWIDYMLKTGSFEIAHEDEQCMILRVRD